MMIRDGRRKCGMPDDRLVGAAGIRKRCGSRQGFTMLELMVVMVIAFILMGMSSMALRGLVRGAGIRGAVSNVRSVVTQARQEAIMKQQRTAVVFTRQGSTNTMRIVMSYGKVATGAGTAGFTAEMALPWPQGDLANVTVYRVNASGVDEGEFTEGGTGASYGTDDIQWGAGDDIAFAVGNLQALPEGTEFDMSTGSESVLFHPDGSAGATFSIDLRERNAPTASGFRLTVDQSTGKIEVATF